MGDITYCKLTDGSFMFLAVVMDLFNREIVGWALGDKQDSSLVIRALSAARHLVILQKTIFHSDQGVQYSSKAFCDKLIELGIIPSMSRKGNCYDNSFVERFFSALKTEFLNHNPAATPEQLHKLIFEYIECWYNRKRLHSSLGYLSPQDYKKNLLG